jgi:hypothetical protein
MAVVLVLVALAMIGGGVFAILEGWPIILSERGWTMVIAGTAVAGSGAVLAGVSFAVAGLRRVERALKGLGEQVGRLEAAPSQRTGLTATREEPPAPVAAVSAEPQPGSRGRRRAPAPEVVPDRETAPEPIAAKPRGDRPAVVASRSPEPEPSAPAPAPNSPEPQPATAAPQAPTVVGTYTSGGNRYVMFSDGSIEAETPNGQFRFDSLDELKAFIAAGGEEAAPAPT